MTRRSSLDQSSPFRVGFELEPNESLSQQVGRLEGRVDGLTATVQMTNERISRFEDALHGDLKGLRADVQKLVSQQGEDVGAQVTKRNQANMTVAVVAVIVTGLLGLIAFYLDTHQ